MQQQPFFNADEFQRFTADFIGQVFSAYDTSRLEVVEVLATQVDDLLRQFVPLNLQCAYTPQSIELCRVMVYQLRQRLCFGRDAWLGNYIRLKKRFFTSDQVAIHAGFHVGTELCNLIGAADDASGLLDPAQGGQQVNDQPDKDGRTQGAYAQRHTDVSRQDAAKVLLVEVGWLGHADPRAKRCKGADCAGKPEFLMCAAALSAGNAQSNVPKALAGHGAACARRPR